LWKKDPAHLMQWYSPWGWGFPGWHLECSVMAMTYLGETLDLHAGGEDLIFPHHECEIAQSESLTGKPFARMWVHTRFLQVEGEKMSKSKGNFLTVRDLTAPEAEGGRGIDPLALRLALISGQYRKPFNFTFAGLKAAMKHVQRFREADEHVAAALADDAPGDDIVGERLQRLYRQALDAMLDDLNTPAAIAAAIAGVKLIGGIGSRLNGASARSARTWLDQVNDLLGVVRPQTGAATGQAEPEAADPLAEQVDAMLAERQEARRQRDFARADAIRAELDALGIEVMDTPEGPKWRRKPTV
ncbi:MAG: cysteine--tRNA ligase, partial [Bacteroidetes bacterium]